MPRRGNRKRLKFRADDVSSHRVTVADFANSDPAVVKSGRVRKAVANAVQKEVKALCGLESSQVPSEDGLSGLSENGHYGSCDELEENAIGTSSRKKKSKKQKESSLADHTGADYPIDIWLILSSYIRPEDVVTFALICKKAWTVTCTAVFWMRLCKRHYHKSSYLPVRLLPECMYRLRSLRACVIRSLFHMYEPFCSRVAKNPSLPESTPNTLLNSKCLLFWCKKVETGSRPEALWEFNFKFKKLPLKQKNHCLNRLQPPAEYKEVHFNPDQDCCLFQVTTLNFIFIPVAMGMTLTYLTINVSTDMRHHRVRLVFQDCPMLYGKKPRGEQGVQIVLDPVHSVHLLDWWHPNDCCTMKNGHWMVTLQKAFYPVLAIVGIPSNLLTFMIFWRSNCGLSPSCRCYMMAIAVADTLVLVQIVILEMILKFYTLEPFWSRGPWCMIRDVLTYGAYNASVWLVVCFTIERFFAIRAVCVKPKICTKIYTLYLIAAVFLCSHLLSIPYLWSNESKALNGTNGFICVYNSQLAKLYVDGFVWLQNTLVYIIPFIIIFTLNGFILKLICQRNKVHSEMQQNRKSFSAFVMVKKQRLKSIVLLVTISMTYSYLCTTRFVTQILIKTMNYDIDREDYSKSINIAADIGTMLDLSNTAVNMYLYACTQPRFRKEIIQLVKSLIIPCKHENLKTNIPVISSMLS